SNGISQGNPTGIHWIDIRFSRCSALPHKRKMLFLCKGQLLYYMSAIRFCQQKVQQKAKLISVRKRMAICQAFARAGL
ncbi:MAG: hypothetical protein LBR14_02295, partial [Clostridiales Family XIII bacterium]|nr:hypothetical protein [Clostridiales Family XIII bacterium]